MTDAKKPAPTVKDMSGYIAKNSNRANDRQPHWRGKVRINGKEFLLSLWEKDGNPELMSVSVTDPATLPQKSGAPGAGSSGSQGSSAVSDPFGDIFGVLPGG